MHDATATEFTLRSFCTFRAEGRLYGIDVVHIREVSTHVATTPVPQAPAAIRGLANLRSRIYLVLDLRPLLGLAPADCTADSGLIIFKNEVAEDLGILVDQGRDIVQVRQDQIEGCVQSPTGGADTPADAAQPLVRCVCKLETELMVVLDPIAMVGEVARQTR